MDLKERERKAATEAKRKTDEEEGEGEARRVAAELAEARRRAEKELARELRRQREVAERAASEDPWPRWRRPGRCCAGYAARVWPKRGGVEEGRRRQAEGGAAGSSSIRFDS